MSAVSVSVDGFVIAAEISSIIPLDFDVLRSSLRLAVNSIDHARDARSTTRYLPVMHNAVEQFFKLWHKGPCPPCGLRPYEKFDVPSQTRARVMSFVEGVNEAMLQVGLRCYQLHTYFFENPAHHDLPVIFDPETEFNYLEARLKEALTFFEQA